MAGTLTNYLTVDGSGAFAITSTVQEGLEMPGGTTGTDTAALLTNAGPNDIAVAMGSTPTPEVKGVILRAGQSVIVGTGNATTFSAVQLSESTTNSTLYITTGS